MAHKIERQKVILKLVSAGIVHNQEELQALLEERGLIVTQATLSRDVNELKLAKYRAADGSLCYRRGVTMIENAPATTSDGVLSIEFCGNMAVVKTHPGFANIVAFSLDKEAPLSVAGTIAGDDTVFVVLRKSDDRQAVLNELNPILPGIADKVISD